MTMVRKLAALSLAGVLVTSAGAVRAEVTYNNDAATLGARKLSVRAGLSYGSDLLVVSERSGFGVLAGIDYGMTDVLQFGAWAGAAYGGDQCVERVAGSKHPSGCYEEFYLAGGVRMRQALLRFEEDLLQFGIEAGASAKRVPDTVSHLGLRLDAALLASAKPGFIGMLYGRAGLAWHWVPALEEGATRLPFATVGVEFAGGWVRPYLEATLGYAWYSGDRDNTEKLLVGGGLVFSFD